MIRTPITRDKGPCRDKGRFSRRRLGWFLGGFAAMILCGDVVLSAIPFPHLEGGTNEIHWKWEFFKELQRKPDVVFIGCSYEQNGIMPTVVDQLVAEIRGKRTFSVNLSASCAGALTVSLLAQRLAESDPPPRVVYLGICSRSADAGFDEWLEFGIRAFAEPKDWPVTWRCRPSLFAESVFAGLFDSYYLWREYRRSASGIVHGAELVVFKDTYHTDQGWEPFDVKGVGRGRTDPVYQAKLAEYFLEQPGCFEPGNPNELALRRAIRQLRDKKIRIKLVEMPLTGTVKRMFRPAVQADYDAFLDRLVGDTGVGIVRAPRDLLREDDFQDLEHLFPHGAEKYSRWLAGDVAHTLASRNERESKRLTLLMDAPTEAAAPFRADGLREGG